ncbi:hypothetical protein CpB0750 [Chlamydia pneumoniae TW-183]|uniref:Uncharacterized protein n=2 Tax=Chlamydia pneumoniae TaxID=83558 RepID=Q9Z7I3_CHLPN|nr:DUF1137 domain-containing protein [Chlamydia pneumoniae]AAD18861.1 CT654 hypothetical protein [Chlamydia pneumoniae CWL029]AAF37919.1 conserved hypothetical protein [Chlamydia pneumoniae AR39]AAP98679.1 hypothetical protein CpB0750 [Chlamydia pneumoniae TW-183]CRI33242.1 Uncharacterized protein BN1224_Wien1_A_07490 [Chlamydia pneumoniae]CRI36105.1 Uncharacterized protein BN1224_CM1_A_07520 [Chlamydia pneumoniae]
MTKFLYCGLFYSLGLLVLAFGTMVAIIQVDQICDVSCMNKHFQESPPFLKIKKVNVSKQICSPEERFFHCKIDKSCMELHFPQSSYSCKEYLTRISGHILTQNFEKQMQFRGNSGLLNYQDGSLHVYDCRFQVDPVPGYGSPDKEDSSSGGMKTLYLSLFRN